METISNFFSKVSKDAIKCPYCAYNIVKPYPKDQLCPKCKKFVADLFEQAKSEEEAIQKPLPKEFETKSSMVSSKLKGKVKVKAKTQDAEILDDKIDLDKGEFVKLFGITSTNRTPLFCSNKKFLFLLELTNNLDFIANSILGGELDKMLLISETTGETEKVQFFTKDGVIYLVYGAFPDKKGKWLLEQMAKHFSEMVQGKKIDELPKLEKYNVEKKLENVTKFILEAYRGLQEVFSDQEIPYVEDNIRIDYIGLSSKSIGVISILLGEDLKVDLPGQFDSPEEVKEMKESILTAKIEAIAANTLGNTGAVPRWIAVKLGFQKYRFLTFQKYPNDFFLYFLSEGNLEKIKKVESELEPTIRTFTGAPFSGNLKPFNSLKITLKDQFDKKRSFS